LEVDFISVARFIKFISEIY